MAGQQEGDQAQSDCPQMQTQCEVQKFHREHRSGRSEQRHLPASTVTPGGAGGASNGTKNRVVMAFTSRSFEQQIINFSHSIINAL